NGIFHESNLVAYLSHGFLSRPENFHCYAEAYFRDSSDPSSGSGRVDLLAYDGQRAFVIEAKKFGDLGASKGACDDVKRMAKFIPRSSPAAVPRDGSWWTNSMERWGVIAIACNDPAASAQVRPLKHKPQRVSSCPAPGGAAGSCRTGSSR